MAKGENTPLQSIIIRGCRRISNFKLYISDPDDPRESREQVYQNSTFPSPCLHPTFIVDCNQSSATPFQQTTYHTMANGHQNGTTIQQTLPSFTLSKFSYGFRIRVGPDMLEILKLTSFCIFIFCSCLLYLQMEKNSTFSWSNLLIED